MNFFQKEKVNGLKLHMKSLLDQQIDFYEKVNLLFFSSNRKFSFCILDYIRIT